MMHPTEAQLRSAAFIMLVELRDLSLFFPPIIIEAIILFDV
jgi:hypothetical protein